MSNKLPNLEFFKNINSLKYATGLALAAIALSGCGKNIKATTATNEQVDPSPHTAAIHKFRQNMTEKGRNMYMMGTCVAWPNQTEGLTITLNPGIAEPTGEDSYLVFSAFDDTKPSKQDVILMDGPIAGDPSVLTLAFKPKIEEGFFDNVQGKVKKQKNGQLSYVDTNTGESLANTVVLPKAPPVQEIVESVCTALIKEEKIPEVSVVEFSDAPEDPAV